MTFQSDSTTLFLLTRNPVVLENAVDADVAVAGHVGVKYAGEEADLGRVEGVVERHLEIKQKFTNLNLLRNQNTIDKTCH